MSQENLSKTLSRELTVPLGENYPDELFRTLKDYVTKLGDISLLIDKEIPSLPIELSDIITQISNYAKILYPWRYVYTIIIVKLKEVLSSFDQVPDEKQEETTIMKNIDKLFTQRFKKAPPFTLQRVCDLLSEPKKFYKTKQKFLRAIDKVLTVISHAKVQCISPLPSLSSESRFSPPAKRLKQELSTASTVIISSDSTSSSERSTTGHSIHFFNEEIEETESSILENTISKKILDNSPPVSEQYLECSVSEADSTTANGVRSIQDSIEAKDENEAKTDEQTETPAKTQNEKTTAPVMKDPYKTHNN